VFVGLGTVVVVIGAVVVVEDEPGVGGRVVNGVPTVVVGTDVVESAPEFVQAAAIRVSATDATASFFIGGTAYRRGGLGPVSNGG
jgi:hypothetical protein